MCSFLSVKLELHLNLQVIGEGPFDIIRKFSDFLYEVNCGYRGKLQTIHADRLRLSTAEWTQHTVECATKKRESLVFECPHCDHASKRKRDLDRHIKSAHNDKVEKVSSDSSADESDWKTHDPGTLQHIIGEPEGHGNIAEAKGSGDLEEGRIIRKPTIPMPIFAPPRQSVLDGQLNTKSVFDDPQPGCSTDPCDTIEPSSSTLESKIRKYTVATQTCCKCKIVRHKRQRITRFEEDDKQVEIISEEEWESEHDC
ncbi:hypothetical protein FSP39_009202 [Pinctada imbricata]|uniref:C2H2-type domain-containing protein n=1 Tax=Pinctada imbricata TaxID=66713 RepID=A0AA89BK89_PINIB|nr:hypothetical protein FSP39_009202 [Pinctada imbricata]